MKSDLMLRTDVMAELAWEPSVNATRIGVAVKEGVVTLSGEVDTLLQKKAVERAARRVGGVRALAVAIDVQLTPDSRRTDADVAHASLDALRWHSLVPEDRIQVQVEDGWVTLTGEVDWPYQHASAEQCVTALVGVRGVTNEISIRAHASEAEIRRQIEAAFARHAQREASHIRIDVAGTVVTLSGQVDTLREHDAAIGTAYAAKGVTRVVDQLVVAA